MATGTNWATALSVDVNAVTSDDPGNDTAPIAITAASAQSVDNNTQINFNGNSSMAYSVELVYDTSGNESFWETESGNITWVLMLDSDFIEEMYWYSGDGNAHMGNYTATSAVNYTYTGNGAVYAGYLRVTSTHDAVQRYYVTILVLPSGTSGGGGVKNPDTFIEVTIGEPRTLDPAVAYDTASGEVLENVYEHLIWYDRASTVTLIPQLATTVPTVANGGISADGLNYTFTLREGIKFHYNDSAYTMDGYDVEFSLERVLTMNDAEGPVWMLAQVTYPGWPGPAVELDPALVNATVDVNATNPFEVTIHLISPYPGFLKVLSYTIGSVICQEAVEDHGGVVPVTQNTWMKRNEAGTGPYQLKAWAANQYVLMERFDDYWREPASIKYVMIKKVQDTGTRLMMLLAGDADTAYIPRAQKASVEGNPDLEITEGIATFNMDFNGFNLNISAGLDIGSVPADFFDDMNIRRAFIHSFDYETFLADIFMDTAIQPNGPIPLGMFAYSSEVPNYTQNLTLAAEFLNKTPYGVSGFDIVLYYNAGNDEREAACMLFKEGLQSLSVDGEINVNVMTLDWPTYLGALYGKQLPVFFLGWGPDYADPDDYVNPFLHSAGAFPYFLSIDNATLDQMIEDAAIELNETLRAEMYLNISWACFDNAYYLWTAQPTNFHVERAWLTGYYFNPMYSGFYFYAFSK